MKKYYCNNCGHSSQGKIKHNKCSNCGEKFKNKRKLFIDYILDQTKDDIKDNIKSGIFDKIKYLIHKYLYGIVLSVTIIGVVTVNVVIKDEAEIVHEKPEIFKSTVKEYNSPNELLNDIEMYMRTSDEESIKNLLYQNNYPDEAKKYNINTENSNFFIHVKIGAYEKNKIEIHDNKNYIYQYESSSYCKKDTGIECLEFYDLTDSPYEIFGVEYIIDFIVDSDNNSNITIAEDDMFFIIFKINNKYYLADIIENIMNPYLEDVDGDASKLNYDTQREFYGWY